MSASHCVACCRILWLYWLYCFRRKIPEMWLLLWSLEEWFRLHMRWWKLSFTVHYSGLSTLFHKQDTLCPETGDFVAVFGKKIACFWIQSLLFREQVWTGLYVALCLWSAEAGSVRREDKRRLRRVVGGRRAGPRRLRGLVRRQRFPAHQRGELRDAVVMLVRWNFTQPVCN